MASGHHFINVILSCAWFLILLLYLWLRANQEISKSGWWEQSNRIEFMFELRASRSGSYATVFKVFDLFVFIQS